MGPWWPCSHPERTLRCPTHFVDLCHLLGVPTPGSAGDYTFEQDTLVLGEARGYADVFYRDHFAWENKAPGRNLDNALKQLLTYALALSNPPLLVVCDRLTTRIHTQFNGHPTEVHTVPLAELDQPEKQALLRRLWTNPESFRPQKTSRDITEAAAKSFATLADGLRRRGPDRATDPATILRIVEPVLSRPLLQKWELVAQEVRGLLAKSKKKRTAAYTAAGRRFNASAGDAAFQKAEHLFHGWLSELKDYRVLDPACGSGNFLFLGLKALKDIEHKSHLDAAAMGLDRQADLVTGPRNVLGIELNEYAAELARVAERTLTKLYNQRPAWLDAAHKALDLAVAQAYGWSDYSTDMSDEEILKRLLALNLERSSIAT